MRIVSARCVASSCTKTARRSCPRRVPRREVCGCRTGTATLRGDAILRAHPNPWSAIRRFTPRSFAEETLLPYGAYNDLMKLVREREFGRAVGIQGASDKRVQGLTFGACGSRLPVAKWHSCPKTTT